MNRKAILIAIVFTSFAAAAGVYVLNTGMGKTESESTARPPIGDEQTSSVTTTTGQYIDYTPDSISNTRGTKLLFFHAPWCPQCRDLDEDIGSSTVPEGITIMKVDYDSSQTLRQKYGVTIQTTIVRVDDSGNLIDKYVAYDEPNLASVLDNLL